jgi:leader peptidase (prepilin peptidase)/N-methyltransferase
LDLLPAIVIAVAGLVLGSFLNVCISRLPRQESVVSPGSHCPGCGHAIRWYHNVPVLSYLMLGGKCADCRRPIAGRYLAVELLTAVLFVAGYAKFGMSLGLLKFLVFAFLLVGLIFMDAETGLLVHEFTYPGIAVGLIFAWLTPGDSSAAELLLQLGGRPLSLSDRSLALLDAVIASVFGAAFFYLIWAGYFLVRKRHGLGFGDIALIAMCGAFLGLKLTLFVIFSAPIAGSMFALFLLARNTISGTTDPHDASVKANPDAERLTTRDLLQNAAVPFGVFLGACALIAVFWGESAWIAYLRFVAGR